MTSAPVQNRFETLLEDLDPRQRRQVEATIVAAEGSAPLDAEEVQDLVDRATGRISFEQYLKRGRSRRTSTTAVLHPAQSKKSRHCFSCFWRNSSIAYSGRQEKKPEVQDSS